MGLGILRISEAIFELVVVGGAEVFAVLLSFSSVAEVEVGVSE